MILILLIVVYVLGCFWLTFELGKDIGSGRYSIDTRTKQISVAMDIFAWPILLPCALVTSYVRERWLS